MIRPVRQAQERRRPEDWKHQPQSLAGKAALVTGGTTGIGRATVHMLAAEGARVLTHGRHEQELHDALRGTDSLGEIHGLMADQASEDDLQHVFEEADRVLQGLDIAIINAAVPARSAVELDPAQMRYVLETNLLGYFHCAQLAVERMRQRGGGQIVAVGSMSAEQREPGADVYAATKAGIAAFAESMRKQVNEQGIRLTLIEPGQVATDFHAGPADPERQRRQAQAGETLLAEDIAEAIYYCITQPPRCDVVELRVRPHAQPI